MDMQGSESISKMRRRGEGREVLRSDFKHPPADLAVLGHDSFSVIPSRLIFCLLDFGWEEKGHYFEVSYYSHQDHLLQHEGLIHL